MRKKHISILLYAACLNVNAESVTNMSAFLETNPNVEQIRVGLMQHKFSCKELISSYIDRVRRYNLTVTDNHAPLNAITQLNHHALIDAERLDTEIKNSQVLNGSLFCVPVIVKDSIDVDGLRTSSGSLALLGTYPIADSMIVHNVKSQGGIILAKSSMDEIAAGASGISSLSGRVGNAYNPSYSSGGSSGGSAVSVAAGFAPLAIGSDNSGSVRIPAAYNGIYGLRPTYGLINSVGIFPMGNIDGVPGPIANNVSDLAKLLTIIANNKIDYAQNLDKNSLSGKHFAVVKSVSDKPLWDKMPKPVLDIYDDVKSNMQKQGATITEINLPKFNLIRKNNMAGTVEDVNEYLSSHISSISQLKEVCRGNSRVFGDPTHCLKFIEDVKSKNSKEYKQALSTISQNQAYITNLMKQQHLDGLILPSGKLGIASDDWHTIGDQSTIASNSGLPEITLPVAQSNGLPVGLDILSFKDSESQLLGYAFAYEQEYYSFKAPKLQQDTKFNTWSIDKLNLLYPLIGKISFDTVIKLLNQNKITQQQSQSATKKAISMIEANCVLLYT